MSSSTIRCVVSELSYRETLCKVTYIGQCFDVQVTVLTPQQSTVVTSSLYHFPRIYCRRFAVREELLHEFRTATVTCPCLTCYIVGCSSYDGHVILESRSHQEKRCTPAGSSDTILQQWKDGFTLCTIFTIISHKQHLVSTPVLVVYRIVATLSVELVSRIHDLLCIFSCLCPLCSTCVNFCIQVKTSQQHPCSSLVSTTVCTCHRCRHSTFNFEQFTFDEVVNFLTGSLWSRFRRNDCQERNVSEAVHQVVVIQSTEEAYFSSHGCIVFTCFFQIEVTDGYTEIKTVVETSQHRMASAPLSIVECRDTFVTPTADSFVSRKFVGIEHLTYKTSCTTVQTIDVAVTISTTVTGYCHVSVAFVE